MAEDPLELIGVTLEGRFRVDAFVGEGELSVTYRGQDLTGDVPVAIRCLNLPMTLAAALSGPFVESFQERTRLYSRLSPGNKNFVQILGSGTTTAPDTDRKVPYEIREWFDATTFGTYCAKRKSEGHDAFTLDEVLTLLAPVADGLSYAHDMGVTHAEINPNNLLVTEVSGKPVMKIVDFGEARSASDKSADDSPVLRVLVPEYAAPELVDKQLGAMGTWTDVFSLGVVVLECLAGTLGTRNVAASVIVDPKHRPSVKKLGPSLPGPVQEVLERALALEPTHRQKNVATLWRELRAAAAAPTEPAKDAAWSPAKPAVKKPVAPTKPAPPRPPLPAKATSPRAPPVAPAAAAAPVRAPVPAVAPGPEPVLAPAVAVLPEPPPALAPPTPSPAIPSSFPKRNPLMKETLVGIQPMFPVEPKAAEPASAEGAEFGADEAPTRRREPLPEGDVDALLAAPIEQAPTEAGSTSTEPHAAIGHPSISDDELAAGLRQPGLLGSTRARLALGGGLVGLLLIGVVVRACAGSSTSAAAVASSTTSAAPAPPAQSAAASTASATAAGAAPVAPSSSAAPQASEAASGEAPPSTSSAPSSATPTAGFTKAAANAALESAGGDLAECKGLGTLRGSGSIRATFNKAGGVARITIGPPYADTPEGACIMDRFGRAQMAPFRGSPGAVNYVFSIPK